MKNFYNDLGQTIKKIRKSKGISGVAMSEKLGVSYTLYNYYEKGDRRISVIVLLKICNILNITIDNLIARINEPEPEIIIQPIYKVF